MPPSDNMNVLVIRTGECSGQFILNDVHKQILKER